MQPFYKFTSSKFKTYFVLSTNCVLLADSIVGEAGTDILSPQGFIVPGTYQDYLDLEFKKTEWYRGQSFYLLKKKTLVRRLEFLK